MPLLLLEVVAATGGVPIGSPVSAPLKVEGGGVPAGLLLSFAVLERDSRSEPGWVVKEATVVPASGTVLLITS